MSVLVLVHVGANACHTCVGERDTCVSVGVSVRIGADDIQGRVRDTCLNVGVSVRISFGLWKLITYRCGYDHTTPESAFKNSLNLSAQYVGAFASDRSAGKGKVSITSCISFVRLMTSCMC